MARIVEATWLAPDVKRFRLEALRIAKKQRPGQFVIVRAHDHGERIPLTIADGDRATGTIDLIVQGVGKTTRELNERSAGDDVLDLVGPLGAPSDIGVFGHVVVVGGGVGAAIAYPVAVALKQAGNRVTTILGAKAGTHLILERELGATSDVLHVTTDDGSAGERGFVTDKLAEVIRTTDVDRVFAVGPIPMMKAVAEVTRPSGICTIASLNPIMVDGTGMCGGCRVNVGGESKFACVDGPEFDAHLVDFDGLAQRNTMYRAQEQAALQRYEDPGPAAQDRCRLLELIPNHDD